MDEQAIPILRVKNAAAAVAWYQRLGFHTLVYLRVSDVFSVAKEFDAAVHEQPWAHEIELRDPDGNRLRIGTPKPQS